MIPPEESGSQVGVNDALATVSAFGLPFNVAGQMQPSFLMSSGDTISVAGQSTVQLNIQQRTHSGPLPSPDVYREYIEADPEAGPWIRSEAAKNSEHFRALELTAAKAAVRDAQLFRLLPFGVVLAFLTAFVLVTIFASAVIGGLGLGATVAAVVLAYLKGFGFEFRKTEASDAGAANQLPIKNPEA